jgi:hypothetical protein
MDGNREQLVPHPVSERGKRRWQHEPVHDDVNADPVQRAGGNRMNRQKRHLPAGQVKSRYDHKSDEKVQRQAEPSRQQTSFERVRTEQSSGDSLQSAPRPDAALPPDHERGRNVQDTDDQTCSEDCAKRLEFFMRLWRSLLTKTENQETKKHADFVSFPVFLDSRFVVSSWKKCLRPFEF